MIGGVSMKNERLGPMLVDFEVEVELKVTGPYFFSMAFNDNSDFVLNNSAIFFDSLLVFFLGGGRTD